MRVGIDIRVADPVEPGQQRYLRRLGAWLADEGHDVHFLTVRPQPERADAPRGTTLHRLHATSPGALRRHVTQLELDALLLNPERSRRYRGVHANVLRSGYGTEHYVQKLRSFRQPAEHALRSALRMTPWEAIERRWERAFYEEPSPPPRVIAQSAYMREQILESYRIPSDHVHVIHNAIDTTEYDAASRLALRSEERARWGIPDDVLCLLFLGHNFRLKGLWQLLGVVARSDPSVHLLVAGRGTGAGQRRKAVRMIHRLGLDDQVVLAGPIRPSLRALAAADALVHLSWHDSFGFVALEAMACGLPVVTTSYVGAAELIEPGVSGLVVDPARDDEIVGAVARLTDPSVRAALGTAAAKVGAAHDEPSNFRRVAEVMKIAVAEGTGPIRG